MLCMGIDHFSMTLYDNPKLAETLITTYFDWLIEVAKKVNQLDVDLFCTADDCAFKTGPMLSPQMYRELVAPHYARMRKELDIPWLFHSDGNIMDVVPILIKVGVNAVHPFENTAMDIRAAKKAFGNQICLAGNVDLNLLGGDDPDVCEMECASDDECWTLGFPDTYLCDKDSYTPAHCVPASCAGQNAEWEYCYLYR